MPLPSSQASQPNGWFRLPRTNKNHHGYQPTGYTGLPRPDETGRLDRKIEIPLPNEVARMEILKIHATPIQNKEKSVSSWQKPLASVFGRGFNGADLRNVCTEAGMFAIRDDRDYIVQDDLNKAVRKIQESKKHETKMEYGDV
ncbi:hypothetical protein H4Q26_018415 [Puccinia striiformis f. sp. tritici PST-130]|nr:hypothetical protein H4Q26_018415 [Puccinia striiformis f. sp. tritici PST-130]